MTTTTGPDLRDAGVADVLAADTAAHRGYAELVEHAIAVLALHRETFTAEDARELLERTFPDARAHSDNVLPAVFAGARARGLIRPVGYTQAQRPSAHARVIRVWQGAQR